MGQVVALPVKAAEGWKLGDLVRIPQGRGHIYAFSPQGGFCDVKLVQTGAIIRSVRVTSLSSGRLL